MEIWYNGLPCYRAILSMIRMRMLYNSILECMCKVSNYYDDIFWYVESRWQHGRIGRHIEMKLGVEMDLS